MVKHKGLNLQNHESSTNGTHISQSTSNKCKEFTVTDVHYLSAKQSNNTQYYFENRPHCHPSKKTAENELICCVCELKWISWLSTDVLLIVTNIRCITTRPLTNWRSSAAVKLLAESGCLSIAAQHSSVSCCINVLRQLADLMTDNGTWENSHSLSAVDRPSISSSWPHRTKTKIINTNNNTTTTHTLPFYGPLSGSTAGGPVPEETFTHHTWNHHPSFISLLHLSRFIASSRLNPRALQSLCTTSIQVLLV